MNCGRWTSQDSYYFLRRFGLRFAFFLGPPIGAGRRRRPTIASILLMNVSDPRRDP